MAHVASLGISQTSTGRSKVSPRLDEERPKKLSSIHITDMRELNPNTKFEPETVRLR